MRGLVVFFEEEREEPVFEGLDADVEVSGGFVLGIDDGFDGCCEGEGGREEVAEVLGCLLVWVLEFGWERHTKGKSRKVSSLPLKPCTKIRRSVFEGGMLALVEWWGGEVGRRRKMAVTRVALLQTGRAWHGAKEAIHMLGSNTCLTQVPAQAFSCSSSLFPGTFRPEPDA